MVSIFLEFFVSSSAREAAWAKFDYRSVSTTSAITVKTYNTVYDNDGAAFAGSYF